MPQPVRVQRLDSITLDKTYFTAEGYLIDHPIVTSVGIFEYKNKDGTTRRELRLPEEVFAAASLESYKGKPVIITHDAGYVNKENEKEEHIGTILSKGYQDGNDVRVEIVIHDTDAMKRSGLRELSLGYSLDLDETAGVWNGQPYDAIQRNIIINHLALVDSARAGGQARLNIDSRDKTNHLTGGKKMASKKVSPKVAAFKKRRAARLDALEEEKKDSFPPSEDETEKPDAFSPEEDEEKKEDADDDEDKPTELGEEAAAPEEAVVERRTERDKQGDPKDMDGAMETIADQDEDIDTLLGVIDALKALAEKKRGSAADSKKCDADDDEEEENADEGEEEETGGEEGKKPFLPKADRADAADNFRELLRVVRIGDRLNMDGLETMSVKAAKKTIIKKLKPGLRLDGKSSAYVSATFDILVSDMTARKDTNYQRRQIMNHDSKSATKSVGSASEARQRMINKRMKKEDE